MRRDAAAERARYTARISILESLIGRLKTAEPIGTSEIERLTALSRKLEEGHETDDLGHSDHRREESISWKEVFFGTRRKGELDESPEDRGKQELNAGNIH